MPFEKDICHLLEKKPFARRETNRVAVRIFFAAVLLGMFGLILIRALFGEPYPGPFMPAFKGTGLHMLTKTEATTVSPKIRVAFSDQTSADVTEPALFGDIPRIAVRRVALFTISPNPDADPFDGHRKGYGKWLTALFPGHYLLPAPPLAEVTDDLRDYLRRRLAILYPGKMPITLTISLIAAPFLSPISTR